jgi:hypothetical protein
MTSGVGRSVAPALPSRARHPPPYTAAAVSKETREALSDWFVVAGALLLFGSLFLTWSHQLSPSFLALFGSYGPLRGVPRDPTAWQVYSAADVCLAVLAAGLFLVALVGSRATRLVSLFAAALGLAFVLHALSSPPTNGAANIFNPANSVPNYLPLSPGAGLGETVALVALGLAIAGLALSLTAD